MTRLILRGRSVRSLPLVNRLYYAVFRVGGTTGGRALARYRGMVLAAPAWDRTIAPSLVAGYYERFEVDVFEHPGWRAGRVNG